MGKLAASAISKTEDDWQREATLRAVAAARAVVSGNYINQRASIGSLSDVEWGWIVAGAIFEWIKTRAEQATSQGGGDLLFHTMSGRDPEPWEAGAVAATLPALGNLDLDWERPVSEWSKDQIVTFAWQSHKLVTAALADRDAGAVDKVSSRSRQEREVSAANGGPLMDRDELINEVPFFV